MTSMDARRRYVAFKVGETLARVGAPDADPSELVDWGVTHFGESRIGVMIDRAGHIVARAQLSGDAPASPTAWYVYRPGETLGREIGLGAPTGTVLIRLDDITRGAGPAMTARMGRAS